jgi:hypothetical protein
LLQIGELHNGQCFFVTGSQHDLGRNACLIGFLPTGNTETPAIAGFKSGEFVGGHRGTEVIAPRSAEFKEFGSDFGADSVATVIRWPGLAEAIAVEPGAGAGTATLEFGAEDIFGAATNSGFIHHYDLQKALELDYKGLGVVPGRRRDSQNHRLWIDRSHLTIMKLIAPSS